VRPKNLLKRYVKWFEDQLKVLALQEKERITIMLADKLCGELFVGKDGCLHWQLLIGKDTFEELAALEHEQWMEWSKSVAQEVSAKRRKRWEKYWVPYAELDESVKEWDREWARKVLEILKAKKID